MDRLRALGVFSGIGSMLVGARQAGFEIVGNMEPRSFFHATDDEGWNTFRENFPGAFFSKRIEDHGSVDLVMGHPSCGAFGNVAWNRRDREGIVKEGDEIPQFVAAVAAVRPRFFVMDNLPKSLRTFGAREYAERLPDYDLFFEWVTNAGYGSPQHGRRRLFVIGALREERFVFIPGESDDWSTTEDAIGDLTLWPDGAETIPNHRPHAADGSSGCPRPVPEYERTGVRHLHWRELAEWFRDKPEGYAFRYVRADGVEKSKFTVRKATWHGSCPVITGGRPIIHPLRLYPFTIRERARVMGFPDDFVFYGEYVNDRGEWDHEKSSKVNKQTGKAIDVRFCRYISRQIVDHVSGIYDYGEGTRSRLTNKDVDREKMWYCDNVGYADQERACASCWLYDRCTIRSRKYQIGEPRVGQRDLYDPGVVPVKGEPSPEAPRPRPKPRSRSDRFVPPEGRSKIRGSRPGIGRRMEELIRAGESVDSILRTVYKEFPGTAAKSKTVAKIRARMK